MQFEVYIPKGILKDFVESVIFLGGNDIGNGIAFQRMQQTIIINLGTNFGASDIYTAMPRRKGTTSTVWINGKQEIPFLLENNGVTAMYAIGIRPGRLPWLADLPAIETNEETVGAENWTSKEIFNLREQLLACADVNDGFLLIEQYLTRQVLKKDLTGLDKIKWLDKAIHINSVEQICQSLGVTRKKLRSEAQYYFGGPVKNIQGILRFNNILSAIAHNSGQPLSSLHEYYDQAHFINDFKARSGITPLQYRKLCRRYPVIRQTPNFLPLSRETFLQFISGGGL